MPLFCAECETVRPKTYGPSGPSIFLRHQDAPSFIHQLFRVFGHRQRFGLAIECLGFARPFIGDPDFDDGIHAAGLRKMSQQCVPALANDIQAIVPQIGWPRLEHPLFVAGQPDPGRPTLRAANRGLGDGDTGVVDIPWRGSMFTRERKRV